MFFANTSACYGKSRVEADTAMTTPSSGLMVECMLPRLIKQSAITWLSNNSSQLSVVESRTTLLSIQIKEYNQ
jgi:hypothetical protein